MPAAGPNGEDTVITLDQNNTITLVGGAVSQPARRTSAAVNCEWGIAGTQ